MVPNWAEICSGPVDKSKYLGKKYLGITEYISKKFKKTKTAMLIYNKELSVCPSGGWIGI